MRVKIASVTAGLMAMSGVALAADLPSLSIAKGEFTVSGISSGAFMANQFHVAHSASIRGSGLVAGGLYACSVSLMMGDKLTSTATRALNQCMRNPLVLEGPARFENWIKKFGEKGWIDDPSNLDGDAVYLFTGRADTVVSTKAVETAEKVLSSFGAKTDLHIKLPDPEGQTQKAGHSFVTLDAGNKCATEFVPYVNACNYDQAKDVLEFSMSKQLAAPSETLTGTMIEFDQAPFIPNGKKPIDISMWDKGFVYVPKSCEASDANCELHVSLHGCKQSDQNLKPDQKFYNLTGYNRWADTNNIVVLYPQARAVGFEQGWPLTQGNPEGCWNWWGYTRDDMYLTKQGEQMIALKAMADKLRGM